MDNNFRKFLEKLFGALGIELPEEGATLDQTWKLVEEKLTAVKDRMADEAVDEALQAGAIRPEERDWALDLVHEHGIEVFNHFAAKRLEQIERCETFRQLAGIESGSRSRQIDDLQRRINIQMGVSDEVYLLYNGVASSKTTKATATVVTDKLQAATNKALGLSPELFKRYYPDG